MRFMIYGCVCRVPWALSALPLMWQPMVMLPWTTNRYLVVAVVVEIEKLQRKTDQSTERMNGKSLRKCELQGRFGSWFRRKRKKEKNVLKIVLCDCYRRFSFPSSFAEVEKLDFYFYDSVGVSFNFDMRWFVSAIFGSTTQTYIVTYPRRSITLRFRHPSIKLQIHRMFTYSQSAAAARVIVSGVAHNSQQ